MPDIATIQPVLTVPNAGTASATPLWRLVAREIKQDDIFLRASALAYSSLASLVPVVAIILAVLSGPAFKDRQERVLDSLAATMVPSEESWIIDAPESPEQERFKQVFRENIVGFAERAGAVSVFGFLILMLTVGLLFRTVEKSFNVIWRAASQRSFFMRVAVATSMIFWGPVMLALSVTLTEKLSALPIVGTYILPMVFTTLAFTFFYMVMPNAKVKFACALKAGAITALCWELVKLLFYLYVTQVVSYNHVYGSLGLIPMLFLWVYVNWVLVLTGAEIAYCLQFRRALQEQHLATERQQRGGQQKSNDPAPSPPLILAVAIEVTRRFQQPCPGGVKVSQIADSLQIERGSARATADRLAASGVLLRVARENEEDAAYVPAGDPKSLELGGVLVVSFDENGLGGSGPSWEQARTLIQACAKDGAKKLSLQDIAAKVPASASSAGIVASA
ncbi:MAG TPA: YihY/virulence factor BrkB family protein [Planctomycetota bacterium]|nr:YihY/virulence factor BrkB family protein [Planctomycetota bacterium]